MENDQYVSHVNIKSIEVIIFQIIPSGTTCSQDLINWYITKIATKNHIDFQNDIHLIHNVLSSNCSFSFSKKTTALITPLIYFWNNPPFKDLIFKELHYVRQSQIT